MDVVYIYMYECIMWIITVQLIQFCPLLQLLQSFFQNIALKGFVLDTETNGYITVSILQKNILTKCTVDPKQ